MEDKETAVDPNYVAAEVAEIHARLLEAEDSLKESHEAKAALILRDCIDDMGEVTETVKML